MANKKMEVEFTPEQLEKVKLLEENGISVGDAIDKLFEFKEFAYRDSNAYLDNKISQMIVEKEDLESKLSHVDDEINIYSKLKESTMDLDAKMGVVEKEYSPYTVETYDVQVQNAKRKISWAKDFFKF